MTGGLVFGFLLGGGFGGVAHTDFQKNIVVALKSDLLLGRGRLGVRHDDLSVRLGETAEAFFLSRSRGCDCWLPLVRF